MHTFINIQPYNGLTIVKSENSYMSRILKPATRAACVYPKLQKRGKKKENECPVFATFVIHSTLAIMHHIHPVSGTVDVQNEAWSL